MNSYPLLVARDDKGIVIINLQKASAHLLTIQNGQIAQNLYGHASILEIVQNTMEKGSNDNSAMSSPTA